MVPKTASSRDDVRRRLLYASVGMMAAAPATLLYNLSTGTRGLSRFADALRADTETNGRTREELEAEGVIPGDSRLITESGDMVRELDANVDALKMNPVRRIGEKLFNRIVAPQQVASGSNAFYLRREGKKPIIAVPPGKMSPTLVRHELGHFLADSSRPAPGDYQREYAAASRRVLLSALFRPDRIRDDDGTLTRYGLEVEAWDKSGVDPSNRLRRLALSTYRGKARRDALMRVASIVGLAGLGLGIYTLKRYPFGT